MEVLGRAAAAMTGGPILEAWLGERRPQVPPAFLPVLLREADDLAPDADGLAELGERALRRALETPGRVREAAFHLLAGDAFLTYACEALAGSRDVEGGLGSLLERLGARLR